MSKRTLTTPGQRRILAALEVPEPPAFADFEVAAASGSPEACSGSR